MATPARCDLREAATLHPRPRLAPTSVVPALLIAQEEKYRKHVSPPVRQPARQKAPAEHEPVLPGGMQTYWRRGHRARRPTPHRHGRSAHRDARAERAAVRTFRAAASAPSRATDAPCESQ